MNNKRICVFLRGINVNGIKIKMDALKEAFIQMGFEQVKTVLATGNVIVSLNDVTEKIDLKTYIEAELSHYFNYDAHVLIRTLEKIEGILKASQSIVRVQNHDAHLYVLFTESNEIVDELSSLFETMSHSESESIKKLESDLFWLVPKGQTLESEFGSMVLGKKKYKDKLTSRNINTIEKIMVSEKA